MTDGSRMGITADRALQSVIGGKDDPIKEEQRSSNDLRKRIEETPLADSGKNPFEGEVTDEMYGQATDCIAHAMLLTTTDEHKDSNESEAWNRIKIRWPEFDIWIGGASGFMVGFAWNCVRYIHGWDEQDNPAMMYV